MDFLSTLSYKALQSLAKTHGIKANQSSSLLVKQLIPFVEKCVDDASTTTATSSLASVEETIPETVSKVVPEDVVQIVSVESIETTIEPTTTTTTSVTTTTTVTNDEYQISSKVEVLQQNEWVIATILRINKKSFRVILAYNDDEVTVKNNEIRPYIENDNNNDDDEKKQDVVPSFTESNVIENNTNMLLADIDNVVDSNTVASLADIDESCPISHESLVEALMSEVKYSDIVDEMNIEEADMEEEFEDQEVNQSVNVSVSFANINQTFTTATKQPKCVEWNSSAKVSTTFDQTANEVISKKRKSFSNTPVSKVSKPAYEVKLTKAQALRAQSNKMKVKAIENKRLEDNIAKNPFEYLVNRQKNDQSAALLMPKKQTVSEIRSTSAANTMGQRNPLTLIKDNVRPVSALSKPLVNKSSLSSNFKTTHDKMFKGQKSIADIVKRDDNISINMSRALESSKQSGFQAKPTTSIAKRASTSNIHDKENSFSNVTHRSSQRASLVSDVNRKLNMIQYR